MHLTNFPENVDNSGIKDSIDERTVRTSQIHNIRHKIDNKIKKTSDKRSSKVNSNRFDTVEGKMGTEV